MTSAGRILAMSLLALPLLAAGAPTVPFDIQLWEPGKAPMAKGDGPLDAPVLTAFLPPAGKGNGSAVVIAPGGSNIMLMYGAEGVEIAERFNDWGAAAFVLTYRLSPKYDQNVRALDGNRAVQLVRSRAKEWGLNPDKIGLAGFSAGGFLARSVMNALIAPDTASADPIARVSSRPDWLAIVYGAGRATPGEDLAKFPPTFLLSAAHDRGAVAGTVQLFQDMNKAGTVVEMHIYQKGRHGFGAGFATEFAPWMDELKHFLMQGGFLPGKAN